MYIQYYVHFFFEGVMLYALSSIADKLDKQPPKLLQITEMFKCCNFKSLIQLADRNNVTKQL